MVTKHKEYGCIATITDKKDGSASLVVRNQIGKKVKESTHKNRLSALAAWRRFCA